MSITFVRRAGLVCLALAAVTLWMVSSTRVAAHFAGDKDGHHHHDDDDQHGTTSVGGPPFTWVCTPANYDLGNSGNNSEIDIFNGSATTANVTVHFLAKDGTNLAGAVIPGSNPPVTYPGQTGSTTVPLASQNTMILPYLTGQGTRATDNTLLATVSVVSDQPIVVGYNIPFGALQATPCSLLPK